MIASNADTHNKEVTTATAVGTLRLDNLILSNGGTLRVDARLIVGDLNESVKVVAPGTPLPRCQAVSAGPIRVGGNVQYAKVIQRVEPIYPADLRAQGIEATVLLSAVISKDGAPLSLRPQNTALNSEFITAAMDAVNQWRYQPTLLNGEPVRNPHNDHGGFQASAVGLHGFR